MDFRWTVKSALYLRTLFSEFEDQEFRTGAEIPFGDGSLNEGLSATSRAIIEATPDDPIEVVRELKDRLETQSIYSVVTGGDVFFGPWTLEAQAAYSSAEEIEDDAPYSVFAQEFERGQFGLDSSNGEKPRLFFDDAATSAAWEDADAYAFEEFELVNGDASDQEVSAKSTSNTTFPCAVTRAFLRPAQASGSGIRRTSSTGHSLSSMAIGLYQSFWAVWIIRWGRLARPSVKAPRAGFFDANHDQLEINEIDSAIDSNIEDYEVEEGVIAGYVMHNLEFDTLRVVYGVRVEQTDFDAGGKQVDLVEEGAEVDGVVFAEDTVLVSRLSADDSYTDVLPSINLRDNFQENLIGRAAYYSSIARPNPEHVAPFVAVERVPGETAGEADNPDLDRARADNLDVSLAYYPNRDSVLAAGIFYKQIENFIGLQVFENAERNGVLFDEIETVVNLDDADLLGFEIDYRQALTGLPGILSGLLIGANDTYVDSEVDLPSGRTIPVPGQSENVANLIVGFEQGPVDLRLALTYRDRFLDGIDEGGDGIDRYAQASPSLWVWCMPRLCQCV